jgi:hypothetical protein
LINATELESSAKKEFSKAEDKVMSKIPESVGGNKIELYSGRYYATCAIGGAVACGATHTFGGFAHFDNSLSFYSFELFENGGKSQVRQNMQEITSRVLKMSTDIHWSFKKDTQDNLIQQQENEELPL